MKRLGATLFAAALLALDRAAAADSSDPRLDALGYRLMEALQAKPVACPRAVNEELELAIAFCGRTPNVAKRAADSRSAIIDAVLLEDGAVANRVRPGWRTEGRILERSFELDEVPIEVQVDTKSDVVVMRYSQQLIKCLDVDQRLIAEVAEGGEEALPKLVHSVSPVFPTRRVRHEWMESSSCRL